MRAFRAVVLTMLMSLLTSLLAASPASATPGWTPPEVLGAEGNSVDIAVNEAGDAVAVWSAYPHGLVKASYRPAGHDWGHPVELGSGEDPSVVIDAQGDATAAWQDGRNQIADRMPDGTWNLDQDSPVAQATPWMFIGAPTLAIGSGGNLVATWTQDTSEWTAETHFVWRFRDGHWGSVHYGGGSFFTAVTLTPNGVATFAEGGEGLFVHTNKLGAPASSGETVWPGVNVGTPAMASNARGDIVLAAIDRPSDANDTETTGTLIALAKPAGEAWRRAFTAETTVGVRNPAVAINNKGRVAVSYLRGGATGQVEARIGRFDGSTPGDTSLLSDVLLHPSTASIAVEPDGAAAATWTMDHEDGRVAQAAYRPSSGPWGAAIDLGGKSAPPPTYVDSSPEVVAYPNSMFTSVFIGASPMFSDHVDDTVGPTTRMLAPRQDFVRSTRIQVRWESTDALARPRDTDVRVRSADRSGGFGAWSMWKRRTTDNSAVFRGKPGRTYCFSARAYDRVGNLGARSNERCATTPIDDRAFRASSGWGHAKDGRAYLDTLTSTRTSRQWLRLGNTHAKTLRLLARTCPDCGSVQVTHGGRNLGVFDLTSRRTRNKQVILLRRYAGLRDGAVVVRVVSSGQPVQIDGLIASR